MVSRIKNTILRYLLTMAMVMITVNTYGSSVQQMQGSLIPLNLFVTTKKIQAPKRQLFDATILTLQNIGFQIQVANYNTGLINAIATDTIRDQRYKQTELSIILIPENNQQFNVNLSILREMLVFISPTYRYDDEEEAYVEDDSAQWIHYKEKISNPELYSNLFLRIEQSLFEKNIR